jgi:hypothetical protein
VMTNEGHVTNVQRHGAPPTSDPPKNDFHHTSQNSFVCMFLLGIFSKAFVILFVKLARDAQVETSEWLAGNFPIRRSTNFGKSRHCETQKVGQRLQESERIST